MATSFSSLPIVDLTDLRLDGTTTSTVLERLSEQLYDVFATTGFAYLVNPPLTFTHEAVFNLARQFFKLPLNEKMCLAKKTFNPNNHNTYRGYFPVQPLSASDNLKEGFEIGPVTDSLIKFPCQEKINLTESNVWPKKEQFASQAELECLYEELQGLASQLLSLLAMSLGKEPNFFSSYLENSLSTLRLLYYPVVKQDRVPRSCSPESIGSYSSSETAQSHDVDAEGNYTSVKLSCTPHTDSGILTLLHQDATGGLEVRNSLGQWVAAPYIPGSIVVNIGDLMAEVSGGRFVATMHRVRAPINKYESSDAEGHDSQDEPQFGRFSVPFFFEPGETCVVRSVDDDGTSHGILYGDHVRRKMKTWVEFQEDSNGDR